MRLKTRFRITTAASLVAVLLLGAVLTALVLETRRITGKVELAQALVKEQYERAAEFLQASTTRLIEKPIEIQGLRQLVRRLVAARAP